MFNNNEAATKDCEISRPWTVDNSESRVTQFISNSNKKSILKVVKSPEPYTSPVYKRLKTDCFIEMAERRVSFATATRIRIFDRDDSNPFSNTNSLEDQKDNKPKTAPISPATLFDSNVPNANSENAYISKLTGSPIDRRKRRQDLFGSPPGKQSSERLQVVYPEYRVRTMRSLAEDMKEDNADDETADDFRQYLSQSSSINPTKLFDEENMHEHSDKNDNKDISDDTDHSTTQKAHESEVNVNKDKENIGDQIMSALYSDNSKLDQKGIISHDDLASSSSSPPRVIDSPPPLEEEEDVGAVVATTPTNSKKRLYTETDFQFNVQMGINDQDFDWTPSPPRVKHPRLSELAGKAPRLSALAISQNITKSLRDTALSNQLKRKSLVSSPKLKEPGNEKEDLFKSIIDENKKRRESIDSLASSNISLHSDPFKKDIPKRSSLLSSNPTQNFIPRHLTNNNNNNNSNNNKSPVRISVFSNRERTGSMIVTEEESIHKHGENNNDNNSKNNSKRRITLDSIQSSSQQSSIGHPDSPLIPLSKSNLWDQFGDDYFKRLSSLSKQEPSQSDNINIKNNKNSNSNNSKLKSLRSPIKTSTNIPNFKEPASSSALSPHSHYSRVSTFKAASRFSAIVNNNNNNNNNEDDNNEDINTSTINNTNTNNNVYNKQSTTPISSSPIVTEKNKIDDELNQHSFVSGYDDKILSLNDHSFISGYDDKIMSMNEEDNVNIFEEEFPQLYNSFTDDIPLSQTISLSNFLRNVGILFYDNLPTITKKASAGYASKLASLDEQATTTASTLPEIDVYKKLAIYLENSIKNYSEEINQLDKDLTENNPQFFAEFMDGSVLSRQKMEKRFSLIKQWAEEMASQEWYHHFKSELKSLLQLFESNIKKQRLDEEQLKKIDRQLTEQYPKVIQYQSELYKALEEARKKKKHHDEMNYDLLERWENDIKEQALVIENSKAEWSNLNDEEASVINQLDKVKQRKNELVLAIEKAEATKEAHPYVSEIDLVEEKEKYYESSGLLAWKLEDKTDDIIQFTIDNDLDVLIDLNKLKMHELDSVLVRLLDKKENEYGSFSELIHGLQVITDSIWDKNVIMRKIAIYWNRVKLIRQEIMKLRSRFWVEVSPIHDEVITNVLGRGINCKIVISNYMEQTKFSVIFDILPKQVMDYPQSIQISNLKTIKHYGDIDFEELNKMLREKIKEYGIFNLRDHLGSVFDIHK
ncbi:unnamed protein product [Cunninghamella blakesleeana]